MLEFRADGGVSQVVNDTSVELREVTKRHGATVAVERLSLTIRKGEFFAILGPSGSGKTTTLRLLAGFEQPDAGEIIIEGRPMQGVPPNLRPVNLVFQNYALFPHMTVADNVAFGLEMKGLPEFEIGPRVAEALEMVRLAGKQDRLPSQLSGGEQQRVALARALVNHPAVLLLDEPLGALDKQLRQEMEVELKALQERVGITFVCVTHDQEEALTMSDRLAVMHHGRLLQIGTPEEVYTAPASAFVANFIGVSNGLSGRVERIDGQQAAVTVEGIGRVQAPAVSGLRAGAPVLVTIRPERLHLSRDQGTDGFQNQVAVRIAKAIYAGNETQYLLTLPNNLTWKARIPNADGAAKRFQAGESVYLKWRMAEAVLLPE
ncbi:MAG TPA: ABC transporter ATP-binding protein [Nitrospirales bacterium]|nr:ABC transporter ATP-binding protein [Nitrospirales bacterium]